MELYFLHIPAPVVSPEKTVVNVIANLIRQQDIEHQFFVTVHLQSDTITLIQCYPPYLLCSGGESSRESSPRTAEHYIVQWCRQEPDVESSCPFILRSVESQVHPIETTRTAVRLNLHRYTFQVPVNIFSTCNWYPTCVLSILEQAVIRIRMIMKK